MTTAKQDYVISLRWLHALPGSPERVSQFANMVYGDFDAIADTVPKRNAVRASGSPRPPLARDRRRWHAQG